MEGIGIFYKTTRFQPRATPMAIKKYAPENIHKKIGFFGFLVVKEPCTGQSTIETWVLPTKWGVHHLSTTNGYHDIEFWHFWRPRATPMHNTPGQTVDFFRNNPKMGFNLISYVPLPKKVVQIFIWPYHWISEHLGYTLLGTSSHKRIRTSSGWLTSSTSLNCNVTV